MQVTNYFEQGRKARAVFLAGLAAAGMLALTGCEDEPPCAESHIETQLIPVFNGKTTTLIPTAVEVCDRYVKESPNG